jgi:hypothetical protein
VAGESLVYRFIVRDQNAVGTSAPSHAVTSRRADAALMRAWVRRCALLGACDEVDHYDSSPEGPIEMATEVTEFQRLSALREACASSLRARVGMEAAPC